MSTPADQAKDTFKNRRRMAKQGWAFILVVGTLVVAVGLSSDDGAARLADAWPAIAGVLATPGAIILAYYSTAAYEAGKGV
jgi:hypothetical protein